MTAVDSGKSVVKPPVTDLVILTILLEHKFNAIYTKVGKRWGGLLRVFFFTPPPQMERHTFRPEL